MFEIGTQGIVSPEQKLFSASHFRHRVTASYGAVCINLVFSI